MGKCEGLWASELYYKGGFAWVTSMILLDQ